MADPSATFIGSGQVAVASVVDQQAQVTAFLAAAPAPYSATATYAALSMIVRGGKILFNANAINAPKAYDAADWAPLT